MSQWILEYLTGRPIVYENTGPCLQYVGPAGNCADTFPLSCQHCILINQLLTPPSTEVFWWLCHSQPHQMRGWHKVQTILCRLVPAEQTNQFRSWWWTSTSLRPVSIQKQYFFVNWFYIFKHAELKPELKFIISINLTQKKMKVTCWIAKKTQNTD